MKLPRTHNLGTTKPDYFATSDHPTTLVDQVAWTSWGGAEASGTGRASWVGPGMSTAQGVPKKVRVLAFDKKMCQGQLAYTKVVWWFADTPEEREFAEPWDICTGNG